MATYVRGMSIQVFCTVLVDGQPEDPGQLFFSWQGSDRVVHASSLQKTQVGNYIAVIDTNLLPNVRSQSVFYRCYSPSGDPIQTAGEGSCVVNSLTGV